ncbi:cytochrome c oxidase assembly protein [Peribacillus alkalitolerans]|uniref:cytochrome c oxidase assembly protein n=1 Tax=Peribacillus alkalitolerans TaxID=1550385 RepID=UPI003B846200
MLALQSGWNTPLLVFIACLGVLYFILIKDHSFPRRHALLFYLGLILTSIVFGSPIYILGHLSFSLHMLQMSILYFVIPPMLLLGIPTLLIQKVQISRTRSYFHSPTTALVLFSGLFLIYHLPLTLTFFSINPLFHELFRIVLLLSPLICGGHLQELCSVKR